MKRIVIVSLIAACWCSTSWARAKTDVIWLVNGDRITCEIKKLEHGKLTVGTDSLGEVGIEWNDISRIQSDYEFQFERTDGRRVTGTIEDNSDQGGISLINKEQTVIFAHQNIVRISQIEDSFWERLKGSLTFGYSFTKASNVAQTNLGFRATHRTEIRSFTLDGNTIVTNDQEGDSTERLDLSLSMTRYRKARWYSQYQVGLESNDEMGLNLRSSIGAGLGRYLIQTNTSELGVIAGVSGSSESLVGDVPSQESIEGSLGLSYSRYIFSDPSLDLTAKLAVFPSITESGRTRAQADIKLRWEIYKDLFWELSYYNSYDSEPASGTGATSDYGTVTSLGWSY